MCSLIAKHRVIIPYYSTVQFKDLHKGNYSKRLTKAILRSFNTCFLFLSYDDIFKFDHMTFS